MTTFQGRLAMMVPLVFGQADFADCAGPAGKAVQPTEIGRSQFANRKARRAAAARARKIGA